jgi:hypothetical protein
MTAGTPGRPIQVDANCRLSIANDSGASWLMNTGSRRCDLNFHQLAPSQTHSLIRSAISIGGFDCGAGGRTIAP